MGGVWLGVVFGSINFCIELVRHSEGKQLSASTSRRVACKVVKEVVQCLLEDPRDMPASKYDAFLGLQVALWYIHRPKSYDVVTTLRPMYLL